ncbi:MAG: 50S ribosomal protein L15 [Saprospiraceae bacterium]|nr:50S ribosomal protein L15 [Saprospiraceae bacterium]MCF8251747.1 50S ribosomal protein L15 [Saprospiraceae bacterium]MCF8281233.1 50S ribosomal protein L15 [Bacteroidales bacterium]MCF8313389.1 50S ribosomal protein L15 [Saprospiraceae bacterium]MCF8442102.1 50S ribosomal protein L15 [Saprospiraceae bacterium]
MELHNLKPAKGATHKEKRIGRGQGSGKGGTAGKGHNGAKARTGHNEKRGFEGGQTPLQRRVPKRGFKNPNRIEFTAMNLDRIQEIVEKYKMTDITLEALQANGIIGKNEKVKILGRGELSSSVKVTAHAVSATAKQAIEEKGGSVNLV